MKTIIEFKGYSTKDGQLHIFKMLQLRKEDNEEPICGQFSYLFQYDNEPLYECAIYGTDKARRVKNIYALFSQQWRMWCNELRMYTLPIDRGIRQNNFVLNIKKQYDFTKSLGWAGNTTAADDYREQAKIYRY